MSKKTRKSNKPAATFLKPKPIKVITKKVLTQIADGIYNPKTGSYLNLCSGTLQNGPDPVCDTRTMHCGLGELYFVITGKHPEETDVDEGDVVDLVADRSTIGEHVKIAQKKAQQSKKQIQKLGLPDDLTFDLLDQVDSYEFENEKEEDFRECINSIPQENDYNHRDDGKEAFEARAKRVANTLRAAAALLPR